jgi:hypothetical protein
MFSWVQRKPDHERNINALLDRAFEELDPTRFETPLDGAIARRPIVGTLNQLAGQPDRFAPVNLDALTSALAQLAEKSSIENIGRELASNPVVLAVMLGALQYVKRKNSDSETDKKIKRLVARLNQNGRR